MTWYEKVLYVVDKQSITVLRRLETGNFVREVFVNNINIA